MSDTQSDLQRAETIARKVSASGRKLCPDGPFLAGVGALALLVKLVRAARTLDLGTAKDGGSPYAILREGLSDMPGAGKDPGLAWATEQRKKAEQGGMMGGVDEALLGRIVGQQLEIVVEESSSPGDASLGLVIFAMSCFPAPSLWVMIAWMEAHEDLVDRMGPSDADVVATVKSLLAGRSE